ncbi:hypothetical protein CA267_009805 [Alteromonas pelagimontana]|uniref:Uncharacterized protein n=1 Tax=Alteromonas pelagimontana TaxID=1858656 RepID=A0A6M4MEK5_9ALTE|nr:hypothetical protein [Alteromonas pelagimontana]QJR81050.1 hypothetical protein CA267_009805 [Alteromonas pelagimontana]
MIDLNSLGQQDSRVREIILFLLEKNGTATLDETHRHLNSIGVRISKKMLHKLFQLMGGCREVRYTVGRKGHKTRILFGLSSPDASISALQNVVTNLNEERARKIYNQIFDSGEWAYTEGKTFQQHVCDRYAQDLGMQEKEAVTLFEKIGAESQNPDPLVVQTGRANTSHQGTKVQSLINELKSLTNARSVMLVY